MKRTLQFVLLAIVVASIVWLLIPRRDAGESTATVAAAPAEYVAYYFHRTARCVTCQKIERAAHDAIFANFTPSLRAGKLLFLPTNVEAPGNEHFIKDYDLVSQALVLVQYQNGGPVRSRNLDKVWDVIGDSAQFADYVVGEVAAFMGITP
jgi:hypothetical protein